MKELSIEEKAIAYDNIIEKANKMHSENCEACQMYIEELIPELKESEDEKVRKEMIFYFTKEIPQCSIQEHSDKMREFILWLKRHEVECTKLELKAGNSYFCYKSRWERADSETFKKGLIYKCNKDGVLDNFVIKNPEQHFIEIKDERIVWLEKQGEQKPTDKVEPKFKVGNKIYLKPEYRMPNDDTPIANTVFEIRAIDDKHYRFDSSYIFIEDQDKYELVEQKSAWSEEDEEIIEKCIGAIRHSCYSNSTKIKAENWLKSLRPQNTWKPSEEQMMALKEAVDADCKDLFVTDEKDVIKDNWL